MKQKKEVDGKVRDKKRACIFSLNTPAFLSVHCVCVNRVVVLQIYY